MADLTRVGFPSVCSPEPPICFMPPYTAGEDILAGDFLAMHLDGLVYRATPADAQVIGVAPKSTSQGRTVSAYSYQRFFYSATVALPLGQPLFIASGIPGGLATSATNNGVAVCYVCDVDKIQSLV